jgi:dihydropyrimidine dehydrogenase (NAD+) subunit PreT
MSKTGSTPDHRQPLHPSGRLEQLFPDLKPLYARPEALSEANRCLYCHDAPCIQACPTHIDIPSFIRKIATENFTGAARTILTDNLLGYSCSRVCPVEVLCVGACVYNLEDVPPIAIGRLQRYAIETAFKGARSGTSLPAHRLFKIKPPAGKRVALVGAGPASLSCAGYLSLEGVETVLFERRPQAGGLNSTGIAPYKITVDDVRKEIDFISSLGVRIETNIEVDAPLANRLLSDYDAVFLGIGLGGDRRMRIPGEDGPGVYGATSWIERMKTQPGFRLENVKNAIVVGGGNTALDACRELALLDVPSVTLVYRRTEADMSGYRHEREEARQEGVRFLFDRVPLAVKREGAKVTGLIVSWSTNGRPLRGAEEELPADLILCAIGQARLAEFAKMFPGIAVDDKNRFVADPATGRTGNPKVYVGGDAFNGGREVVNAVEEGKIAAQAILSSFGVPATLVRQARTAEPRA